MSITRSNIRTACANESYLIDFKVTTEFGADVKIIDT